MRNKINQQKGFVFLLIPILAVILVGGLATGGYFYYKNTTQTKFNNENVPVTLAGTSNIDKQTKWQSYINEKYDFQLSVPVGWKIDLNENKPCCGQNYSAKFFLSAQSRTSDNSVPGIYIYAYEKKHNTYKDMGEGVGIAAATNQEPPRLMTDSKRCINEHTKNVKISESKLSVVEIYDVSNDCFSPIYTFVVNGQKYDYVITPSPERGIGYVGYDGKLETAKTLQDFASILLSFNLLTPNNNATETKASMTTPFWKTYSSTKYNFSIEQPIASKVSDLDITGGRSITFANAQSWLIINVQNTSWYNGVESSPAKCDDFGSNMSTTSVKINGVDFIKGDVSNLFGGMESRAVATEYCTVKNGVAYKIIPKKSYSRGGVVPNISNDEILNYAVNSFKFLSTDSESITVLKPNGGEIISYGDIYMAGDLSFSWKTSEGIEYKPSSNFKAYLLDSDGIVVRDDNVSPPHSNKNGIISSSFIGEGKIKTNVKYKIKVCDLLNNITVCDISDNYFIVK